MVNVDEVCSRRGKFASVERGTRLHNDRPRVRMGGRFAGEISCVEFLEGGVDVVRVEQDVCRYPIVVIELGDAQHFDAEIALLPVAVWGRDAGKGKALPAN